MPESPDNYEMHAAGDEFHKSLGYCITQWASVDKTLFAICLAALRCPKPLAAIVYYRNQTLGSRMVLVNDLVRAILPQTEPGAQPHPSTVVWKSEVAKFNTLSEIRNRLAHDPVEPLIVATMQYADVSAFDVPVTMKTMFWSVPSKDKPKAAPIGLTIEDLRAHYILTGGLQWSLHNFLYGVLMPQILEPPSPHAPQPTA